MAAQLDFLDEVTGAIGKERSSRSSRSKKLAPDTDEKELRKERKLGRKRVCFSSPYLHQCYFWCFIFFYFFFTLPFPAGESSRGTYLRIEKEER